MMRLLEMVEEKIREVESQTTGGTAPESSETRFRRDFVPLLREEGNGML